MAGVGRMVKITKDACISFCNESLAIGTTAITEC